MPEFDSWQMLYLVFIIPSAFGTFFQFFTSGGDITGDMADASDTPDITMSSDSDGTVGDHSGFHISIGGICNFLLGAGISGYLSARWGLLSLFVAIIGGMLFVWLLGTFLLHLRRYSIREEKKVAVHEAKEGMECLTTSTLSPGVTGSVDVFINGRPCGYFARAEEHIPVNTRCIVTHVDRNTVRVRPRTVHVSAQEEIDHVS